MWAQQAKKDMMLLVLTNSDLAQSDIDLEGTVLFCLGKIGVPHPDIAPPLTWQAQEILAIY